MSGITSCAGRKAVIATTLAQMQIGLDQPAALQVDETASDIADSVNDPML